MIFRYFLRSSLVTRGNNKEKKRSPETLPYLNYQRSTESRILPTLLLQVDILRKCHKSKLFHWAAYLRVVSELHHHLAKMH